MNKSKYLIRLDDACPTMDRKKWDRIEILLDKYGIKPMVGVIPSNADPKQNIDSPDTNFWIKVKSWETKDWAIALHGYDHCYITKEKGINPLWARSEFAGVPLDIQREKIRNGFSILKSHGLNPKYFFAPSHTFDENTIIALREESDIRIISDTIAIKPYRKDDFIFIPQVGGACRKMPVPGIWTFCLHPSTMNELSINRTKEFLEIFYNRFVSFEELSLSSISNLDYYSKCLRYLYFSYRFLSQKKNSIF